MELSDYFSRQQDKLIFSRQQACSFAKSVANDFNAIHDADSSRFCVPGDLLFSVLLNELGLAQKMQVSFSDMVSDNVPLRVESPDKGRFDLLDDNDKRYLSLETQGESTHQHEVIEGMIQDYARFSGMNFPHILEPLLKEQGLMLNRKRPLVIYESMSLELDTLPQQRATLDFDHGDYQPNGRRGVATLHFTISENGKKLGHGQKRMLVGALLPYKQEESQLLIDSYCAARDRYLAQSAQ
ncbi:DUF3581 family protein [Aliagarivorans taiwanensis]|uniref:DUF3581 family protein n=1 Tax=Aliagarivorans taiwanensis TaxID=561966 RepID=UPI00040991AC|nr:DUF3581 family protein [Aliagarivorans taiwanensis]